MSLSYYIRAGRPNEPDSFGSTYVNFTDWKNPTFLQAVRNATWETQPTSGGGVGVDGPDGSENGAASAMRLGVFGLLCGVAAVLAAVL